MAKLDVKAFGLACGIVWGVCTLLLGILTLTCGWGTRFVKSLSSLYVGYGPTILGSIIGGIWGFVDAGIGAAIIAWLYNKLAK